MPQTNADRRAFCEAVLDAYERVFADSPYSTWTAVDGFDAGKQAALACNTAPAFVACIRALLPEPRDCEELDTLHPPAMNGYARYMTRQLDHCHTLCTTLHAALAAQGVEIGAVE